MKRILLAISLLLAVTGVQGAVQYEFRQIFHSDVDTMPSNDMAGRAVIDGDRFRVEFLSGTAFPAGSYMIGTNGARQQFWVDPSKKSYVEVNAAGVASALGSRHITIANKKVDLTPMPDHPIVAGLPTDHYRMVMSYEITVPFGQLQLKQNVTTKNIPVVLLTMRGEEPFVLQAYASGCSDFLTKPVNEQKLATVIKKYLG